MRDDVIYLDYAATTPMADSVIDAMRACVDASGAVGNPSSLHIAGRRASSIVEASREQLAALLGTAPGRLVFTSGATESDNLAIRGAAKSRASRGRHLVTMSTEHKAVTDTFRHLEKSGFDVTWLVPERDGTLPAETIANAYRRESHR